jgi:hypothetical protein
MRNIAGVITLLMVIPIWYYLLYQILVRVNATELMFFLFWVYAPAHMLVGIVSKLTEPNK